jgi:hypothetical protein
MVFIDRETGKIYSGTLVDTDKGFGHPVLELSTSRGGRKITVTPHEARFLCLVEATLDERSRLDASRYVLPVKIRRRSPRDY